MSTIIKILKDTPFDVAGTELSIVNFRAKYGWICTSTTTNEELIKYLKEEWKLQQVQPYQKQIGDWFQVLENNFKVGDWVWHESLKRAFTVVVESTLDKT